MLRCLTLAPIVALASASGCSRACASDRPAAEVVEASRAREPLPPLGVVALARTDVRTQRVALDPTYVYFSTLFGGSRRVPRAGGSVEILGDAEFPPAGVALDPGHAYWNGIPAEPARTGWVDGRRYGVDGRAVYRATLEGPREELARSFAAQGISRKVLLLDDARVYWLEPAANAVLSVPRTGGPASFVCEAFVPVHYELALSGDRLYLLDINGELSSAPRSGGALVYHGSLGGYELGSNRNGLWAQAQDGWLYVVSDALGDAPFGSAPKFDGRVVKVELPSQGLAFEPHMDGLLFATNLWFSEQGAPAEGDLNRLGSALEPLRAELAAGKYPVTLSVRAGAATEAAVSARLDALESWLREHVGAGVHVERAVRASPDLDAGAVDSTVYAGLDRRHVPALFAPR